MEKLTAYLQELLSSCSEELHLEPDKNPYLVGGSGVRDVAKVPLPGTQISTIVFPLIPPEVRSTLPNRDQVEFVHSHNLGNFTFTVQKSPVGFNVTIRPAMNDQASLNASKPLPNEPPLYADNTASQEPAASFEQQPYSPQAAPEHIPSLEIETSSFDQPP